MKQTEIKNLRKKIEYVLENFPKGRDSDQWLTLKIWALYYPDYIKVDKGTVNDRKFVYLEDIMSLPREDNVKRIRAVIQNVEKRYLPTSWKVAKQRKINEEEWKEYCSKSQNTV